MTSPTSKDEPGDPNGAFTFPLTSPLDNIPAHVENIPGLLAQLEALTHYQGVALEGGKVRIAELEAVLEQQAGCITDGDEVIEKLMDEIQVFKDNQVPMNPVSPAQSRAPQVSVPLTKLEDEQLNIIECKEAIIKGLMSRVKSLEHDMETIRDLSSDLISVIESDE